MGVPPRDPRGSLYLTTVVSAHPRGNLISFSVLNLTSMAPALYLPLLGPRSVSFRPDFAFLILAFSCGAHLVPPLESRRSVVRCSDVLPNGVLFDSHQCSACPLSSISAVVSMSRGLATNGTSYPSPLCAWVVFCCLLPLQLSSYQFRSASVVADAPHLLEYLADVHCLARANKKGS